MQRLTGRRAAWLGLLSTPVLVIAAVLVAGVATGSAGPQTVAAAQTAGKAAADGVIGHQVTQSLSDVKAYWTAQRMSEATPRPLLEKSGPATAPAQQVASPAAGLAMMRGDGSVDVQRIPADGGASFQTEPYHADIPFSRWEWFGAYRRNTNTNANRVIATVGKIFFTLPGIGNFVCSGSSIGADAAWTAAHCLVDQGGPFATNVLFCPSYDSGQGGVNPVAGCWGADQLWVTTCYFNTGDGDCDMGAIDTTDNGTVQPGLVGNYTSWNGFAWGITNGGGSFNRHWIALGYPAGSPFNGGKIQVAASSLGYTDEWTVGATYNSVAMGNDLTGGSSGGPWIWQFGRPGQAGGLNGLFLNGHNDWRHTAEPGEMASPFFNCLAVAVYNSVNGTAIACP